MNNELFREYFTRTVHLVNKGYKPDGNKRYVAKVTTTFNETKTRREFVDEYARTDPRGCGLFLCKVEFNEANEDRYWDCPDYRDEFKKNYRAKIKAIRAEYGLSQTDVKPYMAI